MKHTVKVTLFIVALFFIAQIVGLITANRYIEVAEDVQTGEISIVHGDTVLGPAPVIEDKTYSFITLSIAVLIGTLLLLVLVKYQVYKVWKYWFLLAVWATISVFLGVYIKSFLIAGILALGFALLKIYKQNVWIYNLTEVMVYSGIVIIILPLFNLFAIFALLVIISIYDMIAVWQTKHMVTMAKFQTKANVFAGLMLPYTDHRITSASSSHVAGHAKKGDKGAKEKHKIPAAPSASKRTAVLGGGDIAFPLLFSSVVMEHLILIDGIAKSTALAFAGLISVFTAISLFLLLIKAKQDKFYPAMPFISLGCLAGYVVVVGILMI